MSKRQPTRLIKLNPLTSTKPVQTRDAAIPLPPRYRSRGSDLPRVQDVTDPAIRSLLFGPFAQIDHHQHYGSGFGARPNVIHHDPGCAGDRGCTRGGNDDLTNSVHPSSTCSTKDDSGSGEHDISSHGGYEAFGHAGTDTIGFGGGHGLDIAGGDGGGHGGGGCD